jgi:Lon protease-like protein
MVDLPMFPLGAVHFPYSVIPLRVFEPRYQRLIDDCLRTDRRFGVVLIERGSEVGGGDQRFSVGTAAEIRAIEDLPDGHRALIAVGTGRFRVDDWLPDDPYPRARVVFLDEAPAPTDASELVAATLHALRKVFALASELGADTADFDVDVSQDPTVASFHLAALAPIGALDAQHLLEADRVDDRLASLLRLLEEEAEMLQARLGEG